MKAIIFGITGQDGSYLAELLLSKGYEVVGVTRRTSTPNTSNINHILQNIVLVEGDVTDGFNVAKIIEEHRPDEVYNLAAQSHVGTSFKQPNLTWDITAGGVLNILEAIRYSDRKDKIRFYQASSSEMFGKNFSTTKGRFGDIKFQDENTPFVPQSPYAIAKLAAHKWIGEYSCWQDSVYSMSQTNRYETDEDNIIINGNYFPKLRLGNLDAKRDWGHAQDYVNAMWLMLQQDTADDYVIGTGETYSVRDFLDAAFSHIDIDDWSSCVVVDPEFYRPAEVDYLLGIPKKAERVLGWERDVSFKQLAERMVDGDVEKARLRRSGLQAVSKTRQIYLSNV